MTTNNISLNFGQPSTDSSDYGGIIIGFKIWDLSLIYDGIRGTDLKYYDPKFLLVPIPFKNGATFNTTMDSITVLEYIG